MKNKKDRMQRRPIDVKERLIVLFMDKKAFLGNLIGPMLVVPPLFGGLYETGSCNPGTGNDWLRDGE
ncbi:hypothetical protein, partial [Pseudomonas viridiflava]|uniref:hypothetical protein n=1 Tax=Pseudomonas viridiflava TaxID=33069 RepID=UPI00197EB139